MSSMKRENLKEFEILSKKLIELRNANNLTQLQVAAELNIAYQSYQAYERGIAVPTLQNFIKLAKYYDVSTDYLIGRNDI